MAHLTGENRKSIFEEAMKVLMGESKSHDQTDQSEKVEDDQPQKPTVAVETIGTVNILSIKQF